MDATSLGYLVGLAAFTGLAHTLMGPDHYVPFIAMARTGRWTLGRTLAITVACGFGHVLGSVLLGAIGIVVGLAVGATNFIQAARGEIAAWLLLGFGVTYTAWGLRRAWLDRPHVHRRVQGWFGTMANAHGTRQDDRRRVGESASTADAAGKSHSGAMTTWTLFMIFVFGPCEPLIPQLMLPAAERDWWSVLLIVNVFAAATIGTMVTAVAAGYVAVQRLSVPPDLARYSDATAGLAVTACGLAIKLGL